MAGQARSLYKGCRQKAFPMTHDSAKGSSYELDVNLKDKNKKNYNWDVHARN